MTQPILLWKPLGEIPKQEPEMVITYGDQQYAVPYTLLYAVIGWIRMGARGTNAVDGPGNIVLALERILRQMREEHYPIEPEILEAYRKSGANVDVPPLPPVRDYRDDIPLTREQLQEVSTLRQFL